MGRWEVGRRLGAMKNGCIFALLSQGTRSDHISEDGGV